MSKTPIKSSNQKEWIADFTSELLKRYPEYKTTTLDKDEIKNMWFSGRSVDTAVRLYHGKRLFSKNRR